MAQNTTQNFYEELINSDWLGRNSTDYTYAKGGTSSGWEKSLNADDAHSKFLKDLTGIENINLFISKCSATINSVATVLNQGKPVRVNIVEEFSSFTDMKEITVTSEPLYVKDKTYFPTLNHRLDPVLGYTIHEMAHILYTEPEYNTYLKKFEKNPVEFQIRAALMNLLEDERIENLIAKNFSGYTGYLGKSKDYCFGYKFEKEKTKINFDNELQALMNSLIMLIRFPRGLSEEEVNKFEPEIREVMGILKDYPKTTKQLSEAVDKIFMVLKKYLKKEEQQQQQQSQQGEKLDVRSNGSGQGAKSEEKEQGGEPGDGGNPEEENEGSGNGGKGDKSEGEDKEDGQGKGGNDNGAETEENDTNKGGGNSGNNDGEEMTEEMSAEMGEKVASALKDLLDALSKSDSGTPQNTAELADKLEKGKPCGDSVTDSHSLKDILRGSEEEKAKRDGASSDYKCLASLAVNKLATYTLKPEDISVSNKYEIAYAEVATFASSLRAKLMELNRTEQVVNRNLFEGDFDSDNLVDALIGVKNVYSETYDITNRGAVIGLLIDESGSMQEGNKYDRAMEVAVMFERALDGVNNIDFYAYGHTTANDSTYQDSGYHSDSSSTVIIPYFEGRANGKRQDLGKIRYHGANRDGHAILETVARIRKDVPRDKKIILFVISDGMPSAGVPQGFDKISYTKKCVETVKEELNTDCIHIALDKNGKSEQMFDKYVKFEGNYSIVVHTVGVLLKKILLDNQQDLIKL